MADAAGVACASAEGGVCPLLRVGSGTAVRRKTAAARRRHGEEAGSPPVDCAIVALDPGGTTGWAVLVMPSDALTDADVKILSSVSLYTWGQIGAGSVMGKGGSGAAANARKGVAAEHEQVAEIADMIDSWPHAAIVREDFILRTLNKSRDTLSPVRLGFAIDHLLWERGRAVFTQQPSMAKGTATDDRLKAWGLYRPGMEHARDATRHAITFARRLKMTPSLLAAAYPWLG